MNPSCMRSSIRPGTFLILGKTPTDLYVKRSCITEITKMLPNQLYPYVVEIPDELSGDLVDLVVPRVGSLTEVEELIVDKPEPAYTWEDPLQLKRYQDSILRMKYSLSDAQVQRVYFLIRQGSKTFFFKVHVGDRLNPVSHRFFFTEKEKADRFRLLLLEAIKDFHKTREGEKQAEGLPWEHPNKLA